MRLPFLERYSKLDDHEDGDFGLEEIEDKARSQRQYQGHRRLQRSLLILQIQVSVLMLICFVLGFFLLRSFNLSNRATIDTLLAPAGDIQQIWHYEKKYSRAPDKESEAAWRDIFPKGRGFIHHETLAPNISGIAVFHELHCLHGIRMAYYNAVSHNLSATIPPAEHSSSKSDAHLDALNAHNDPHHIRHCFDYLRQALMCAADSNIEEVDWKLGGTSGWGFKRQCRDYSAVVDWAEKYRLHSQTDIS